MLALPLVLAATGASAGASAGAGAGAAVESAYKSTLTIDDSRKVQSRAATAAAAAAFCFLARCALFALLQRPWLIPHCFVAACRCRPNRCCCQCLSLKFSQRRQRSFAFGATTH